MSSPVLFAFILIPFTLAVAYMLWVLWHLTIELKQENHTGDTHKVIPIKILAPEPARRMRISPPMTSTGAPGVRN